MKPVIEVPEGTPDELAEMLRRYGGLITQLNTRCDSSIAIAEFRPLGGGEYCDLDKEVEVGVVARSGSSWWLHFYRADCISLLVDESDEGHLFPDPKVHMIIVRDCSEATLVLATERFLAQYGVTGV